MQRESIALFFIYKKIKKISKKSFESLLFNFVCCIMLISEILAKKI